MGIASKVKAPTATTATGAQKFLLDTLPGTGRFRSVLTGVTAEDVMATPRYVLTFVPTHNEATGAPVVKGTEYPELKIVLAFDLPSGMENVEEGAGASRVNVLYIGGQPDSDGDSMALDALKDFLGTVEVDKKGAESWKPGYLGWNGEEGPRFAATGACILTLVLGKANEMKGRPGMFYVPSCRISDIDPVPTKEEAEALATLKRERLRALLLPGKSKAK